MDLEMVICLILHLYMGALEFMTNRTVEQGKLAT